MQSDCTPKGSLFWEYILTSKIVENCRGLEEIRVFSCRERGDIICPGENKRTPSKLIVGISGPFSPAGLSGPEHMLKMEGREDFADDNSRDP
ncbi:hypothetical protein COCON_G00101740, partial [Conger conger]